MARPAAAVGPAQNSAACVSMRPGCVRRPRPARTQPARSVPGAARPVEVGAAVALQGEREIARIIDRVVQARLRRGRRFPRGRRPRSTSACAAIGAIGTPGLDHALRQPRALRRRRVAAFGRKPERGRERADRGEQFRIVPAEVEGVERAQRPSHHRAAAARMPGAVMRVDEGKPACAPAIPNTPARAVPTGPYFVSAIRCAPARGRTRPYAPMRSRHVDRDHDRQIDAFGLQRAQKLASSPTALHVLAVVGVEHRCRRPSSKR